MANTNNTTSILDSLSPEAAAAVRAQVRGEILDELGGSTPAAVAPPKRQAKRGRPANKETKEAAPAKAAAKKNGKNGKRTVNRQKTKDGRSASQFVRDCDARHKGDEPLKAQEVVKKAAAAGLDIEPSLVYNVRNNLAKKMAKEEAANGAAKKPGTRKKKTTKKTA